MWKTRTIININIYNNQWRLLFPRSISQQRTYGERAYLKQICLQYPVMCNMLQ